MFDFTLYKSRGLSFYQVYRSCLLLVYCLPYVILHLFVDYLYTMLFSFMFIPYVIFVLIYSLELFQM